MLLALMFHELATNAVKYGALSNAVGRIEISWSKVAERLAIDWIESDAPEFARPTRQGFGTKLLKLGLKQFQGRMETEFHPTGLRFKISLLMPETPIAADVVGQKSPSCFTRLGILR